MSLFALECHHGIAIAVENGCFVVFNLHGGGVVKRFGDGVFHVHAAAHHASHAHMIKLQRIAFGGVRTKERVHAGVSVHFTFAVEAYGGLLVAAHGVDAASIGD